MVFGVRYKSLAPFFMDEILKQYTSKEQEKIIFEIISFAKQIEQNLNDHGVLSSVLHLYDYIDKEDIDGKVACSKGCSFCCYLHVTLTKFEVTAIIDYCTKNNIIIDTDTLKKQSVADNVESFSKIDYKDRKCVFLKDNQCSIYPVRPVACRKYYVVNDPEICNTEQELKATRVRYNLMKEIAAHGLYLLDNPISFSKNLLNQLNHVK